jgi:hypothetical protein
VLPCRLQIEEQIESLDPNSLCDLYWVGKGDRAAVAAGLPAAPPLPSAASAPRGGAGGLGPGRGRKKRRRCLPVPLSHSLVMIRALV